MEKVIRIYHIDDPQQVEDEKNYWKTKTPTERLKAAELLRKQVMGLKNNGSEPKF